MENESKLRPFYLAKILYERTDEEHPLSTSQLIDILRDEYEISSHRITVGKDIDILCKFGLDVYKIESTQNKYFLASRKFETPELRLLISAVESSKYISRKKSGELVEKITDLTSKSIAKTLRTNTYTDNGGKNTNEMLYYYVDVINDAICKKKKLAFQYFSYGKNKERVLKHDGQTYTLSPYTLVWNNDYYYVVGHSDSHGTTVSFRVDKIADIPVLTDEDAVSTPADFESALYTKTAFRMFGCEERTVELICDESTMDSVIDHFGTDVRVSQCEGNSFRATARVSVSPIFFRWVFGFGTKIKINAPEDVRKQYLEMLRRATQVYE